ADRYWSVASGRRDGEQAGALLPQRTESRVDGEGDADRRAAGAAGVSEHRADAVSRSLELGDADRAWIGQGAGAAFDPAAAVRECDQAWRGAQCVAGRV